MIIFFNTLTLLHLITTVIFLFYYHNITDGLFSSVNPTEFVFFRSNQRKSSNRNNSIANSTCPIPTKLLFRIFLNRRNDVISDEFDIFHNLVEWHASEIDLTKEALHTKKFKLVEQFFYDLLCASDH